MSGMLMVCELNAEWNGKGRTRSSHACPLSHQPRPLPPSPLSLFFTDARRLRADHRLVGAMVGGVAGFKQQNSFCGLPLRLGPAELAVAVAGRWVAPYEVTCAPGQLDPFHDTPPVPVPSTVAHPPPAWRSQVIKGTPYAVPLTLESTPRVRVEGEALVRAAFHPAAAAAAGAPTPAAAASALSEARAAAAFADLHARGYALTPGGNFGADWLAYPADPALYHAQLAVRAGAGEHCRLDATLLAASARGAHAARKHLVLAVPVEGEGGEECKAGRPAVFYLTIAPEAGFGPGGS